MPTATGSPIRSPAQMPPSLRSTRIPARSGTAAGVSFDAEVRSQYRVRVHVDDGQGGADTADVVITVTPRPIILPPIGRPVVRRSSGTGAFSIEENSGRDVGSFDATDPEGAGRDVVGRDQGATSGRFEIDEANGALSFKEAPRLRERRPRPRQGLHRHRAGHRGRRRRTRRRSS